MSGGPPATGAPDGSRGGRATPARLERLALRAVAVVVACAGIALTLLARRVFGTASHPTDTDPGVLVAVGAVYALVAAGLIGSAAWGLLDPPRSVGRLTAVAALATTSAALPWSAVTDLGPALNVALGAGAATCWALVLRASRG